MPPVLIKVLGLEDRKPLGSCEQAEKFKAKFQAAIGRINECLQHTAAYAEMSEHGAHAAKRDKICQAYQVALKRIDPADPTVAQKAIDQVLAAVKGLQSSVETHRTDVDESHASWTVREADFHLASDKIRELVEDKHEKAPALQKVSDAIAGKANSRAFGEAVTTFDQLSGKFQPIYEDYKKRKGTPADGNGQASTLANELTAKGDGLRLKVDPDSQAKTDYEKATKAEEVNFNRAKGAGVAAKHFELKNLQDSYLQAKKALDQLVISEKYKEALAKLLDVSQKAKAYLDGRKGYDDYQAEFSKVKADIDFVESLRDNSPPNGAFNAETALYGEMINNFEQGNFEQAIKCMKTLQGKVADLKKRVAENDKKANQAAEAAEKEVQKLAGNKNVKGLSRDEQAQLIKKLKKLTPDKQRKILEDLHGPSTKLSEEQRYIQRALYKAMKLDAKFKQADQKIRDTYQEELQKDEELTNALNNWDAQKDGKDVVDLATKKKLLDKVLAIQSKAYGIDVPKVEWYDGEAGDFGGFSADTTRISLNTRYLDDPEEMINSIIHENTHNFQDELVKKYVAGKLPKEHPMYEQTKTFAITHHIDAYVDPPEDKNAYKVQPEEMQAFDAGDSEASKLIVSASNKKPAK